MLGSGFVSDCWALGVTLVECATGRFPYQPAAGGTMDFWELLECITQEPPPRLPALLDTDGVAPPFSPAFRAFVEACLQKDPAARPSAEALSAHAWLAPAPGAEDATEALLAALVNDAWDAASARKRVAALPPLSEEAPL